MRVLRGFLIGGLLGASFAVFDGAVIGLLLGNLGYWCGVFAGAGAVVGGLGGIVWALFSQRMVLQPPESAEHID